MAACGSLQHIFEKPLPENPTLLESLSPWNQIKISSSVERSSSFTEIFGELHFKESSLFQTSSPVIDLDPEVGHNHGERKKTPPVMEYYSFPSSKYGGSHKNCTEGLGFESSDEVEDLVMKEDNSSDWHRLEDQKKEITGGAADLRKGFRCSEESSGESVRRSRMSAAGGGFPPPISCLSKSGKPRFCFKSYRQDGRFVLKEIRVRSQEFLHACREGGRLKLHFVQPNYDDGIPEEDDDDDNDEEEVELEVDGHDDGDDDEEQSEEDDIGGVDNNGQENGNHQEDDHRLGNT